ncbi:MAG: type IX secretion system membrane protein PorP/SprF [Cytophagales bacterium]|nr:type IX secretion system membrane protein PorP/SprF [Cytophagales bacterium]
MKKILIILSCLFCSSALWAQQQEHYSMYMMNNYLVNPAEGGTEEFVDLKLGYRTQWVGLEGAPATIFLSGHAAINKHTSRFDDVDQLPFHGAGGAVISDNIGPYSILTAKASYSFHLPLTRDFILSFGAFGGVKQYTVDVDKLESSVDGTVDPVAQNIASSVVPDMSAGIWFYKGTSFYGGISAFQLLGNNINISPDIANTDIRGTLARHYFATFGYNIKLNDKFSIIPSFVVKAVAPAPLSLDLNAKFRYEDKAWLGVSYRNQDAVVAIAGVTLKGLIDIAYSYDFNYSDLNNYNAGSHEVLVGLRLPNHEHKPPPSQFW